MYETALHGFGLQRRTCLPVGMDDEHLSAGLSSSREMTEVEKREATDAHVSP